MKKSNKKVTRIIKPEKNSNVWMLYNNIGAFVAYLDREKAAAEILDDRRPAAPLSMQQLPF